MPLRRRGSHAAGRSTTAVPVTGTPPGPEAALDLEATTRALRRTRRRAWAVLGLCLVGLAAVATVVGGTIRADHELRAGGSRADGTVVAVDPASKYSLGSVTVEFVVAGHQRVERVRMGIRGDAQDFRVGERVAVIYDPAELARLTIDDVPYEPPGVFWALIAAALLALLSGPIGVLMLWQVRRSRWLLARGPWQEVQVRVLRDERGFLRFVLGGYEVWRSSSALQWPLVPRARRRPTAGPDRDEEPPGLPPEQVAWWVSDGRGAVFSPGRASPLVYARRPRR